MYIILVFILLIIINKVINKENIIINPSDGRHHEESRFKITLIVFMNA